METEESSWNFIAQLAYYTPDHRAFIFELLEIHNTMYPIQSIDRGIPYALVRYTTRLSRKMDKRSSSRFGTNLAK